MAGRIQLGEEVRRRRQVRGLDLEPILEAFDRAGEVVAPEPVGPDLEQRLLRAGSRMSSSRPSSRASNSTRPSDAGRNAHRSTTRGISSSPRSTARRSALATSVSYAPIENRTDTPLRWLTCGLFRRTEVKRRDDLHQIAGDMYLHPRRWGRGLLFDDLDLFVDTTWVVGLSCAPKRSFNGVMMRPRCEYVLGVGARDQDHVQREPYAIAPHLDIALLEDVQQRDLDPLG